MSLKCGQVEEVNFSAERNKRGGNLGWHKDFKIFLQININMLPFFHNFYQSKWRTNYFNLFLQRVCMLTSGITQTQLQSSKCFTSRSRNWELVPNLSDPLESHTSELIGSFLSMLAYFPGVVDCKTMMSNSCIYAAEDFQQEWFMAEGKKQSKAWHHFM